MMEEKKINRGDVHKAFINLMDNDEATAKLMESNPLLVLVFGIIVNKIEDVIFGEENE